jgi:hypothetical protein
MVPPYSRSATEAEYQPRRRSRAGPSVGLLHHAAWQRRPGNDAAKRKCVAGSGTVGEPAINRTDGDTRAGSSGPSLARAQPRSSIPHSKYSENPCSVANAMTVSARSRVASESPGVLRQSAAAPSRAISAFSGAGAAVSQAAPDQPEHPSQKHERDGRQCGCCSGAQPAHIKGSVRIKIAARPCCTLVC